MLPDEIIMEILSRMPADNVWKLRSVCRKWKALISSQFFAEMQLKEAYRSPMILAKGNGKLELIDKCEPPRKRTRIRRLHLNFLPSDYWHLYCLRFSFNGLILFTGTGYDRFFKDYIILNPATGEKASIIGRIPGDGNGDIYGMFFNPEIKEYCVIWGLFESGPPQVLLKMFSLGSQSYSKDLKPPSSWIQKVRTFCGPPVIIDEDATVYWMVRDRCGHGSCRVPCEEVILAFDIKTEQFSEMPHPGPITHDCYERHLNMNILKMGGRLSFVHSTCSRTSVIINIWTLQDSVTRVWIQSHSVTFDECLMHEWLEEAELQALAVGNGELLLQSSNTGVFDISRRYYACNFELGTIRKVGRKSYDHYDKTCAHVPSLLSLKNCIFQI